MCYSCPKLNPKKSTDRQNEFWKENAVNFKHHDRKVANKQTVWYQENHYCAVPFSEYNQVSDFRHKLSWQMDEYYIALVKMITCTNILYIIETPNEIPDFGKVIMIFGGSLESP